MESEEIIKKIKQYISFITTIDIQNLEENKSLIKYYKLDLLELYDIITQVEYGFDITISQEEFGKIDTINSLAETVSKKKSKENRKKGEIL